ncbi:MAG: phospho-N-acetylmuramoyl-pentapeptide-transferase [Synergistaceae bacterium]|jgi:phospho-N-acetylmuramoyl-pentapeptide-transferase|nr:phospho-N-acetylmuramoyl-pentapeptide-transferase [Synergistaceae bacterium]
MKIKILCLGIIFFSVAIYMQGMWIALMRRMRLGEAIKEYGPEGHKKKRGTPGMGGIVVFLLAPFMAGAAYLCELSGRNDLIYIWSYPLMAGLVGLADDVLKYSSRSSEGLRSLQKLFLQIVMSGVWVYFVSRGGVYLTPNIALPGYLGAPLLVFLCVAALNAVNVTDGLDGLAGGAVSISLATMFIWARGVPVLVSASLGLAAALAFLWHNSNPAAIFMGDVGSHFWGGLLLSLCVASHSMIFVIPAGFIFGIELATSAIQIFTIRAFGKRVFRMSPLHHHFELSGLSEPSIVARFMLAHLAGIIVIIIFIETILRGGAGSVR